MATLICWPFLPLPPYGETVSYVFIYIPFSKSEISRRSRSSFSSAAAKEREKALGHHAEKKVKPKIVQKFS